MKIGILISQTEPETVWNALRLGNFSLEKGHNVRVFLIGKGVEIEEIENVTFNVNEEIEKFVKNKGEIFSCGTCLISRNKKGSKSCPISNMQTLMEIVEESDKIVTF